MLNTILSQLKNKTPALEVLNKVSSGKAFELTGCTTEQILYFINKGTPVVGIVDKDSAIVIVAYDKAHVSYVDVEENKVKTITYEQMDKLLEETGRAFVGYIK